jgi:hypothetical protein
MPKKMVNFRKENGQPLATKRKANPKRSVRVSLTAHQINANPDPSLAAPAGALSSDLSDGSVENRTPREDASTGVDDLPSEPEEEEAKKIAGEGPTVLNGKAHAEVSYDLDTEADSLKFMKSWEPSDPDMGKWIQKYTNGFPWQLLLHHAQSTGRVINDPMYSGYICGADNWE